MRNVAKVISATSSEAFLVIMAALRSRCGHYIFPLWFLLLSIFLSSFFPRSQPSQIGCLPYFHTWCGLSANLGRRSETCCARLAGNTGRKKSPKICYLGTIAQLCRAISSQLRHVSTIGKILLNSNTSPHVPTIWRSYRRLRSVGEFGTPQ